MVGLIPLFAVETLEPEMLAKLPGFQPPHAVVSRQRPGAPTHIDMSQSSPNGVRHMLSLVSRERLPAVLGYMLDEKEFLSPHGIRALSKFHAHPYMLRQWHRVPRGLRAGGIAARDLRRQFQLARPGLVPHQFSADRIAAEISSLFWGRFAGRISDRLGQEMTLWEVAAELSRSLTRIFLRDKNGRRPVYGANGRFQNDPYWRDLILFYEYFHGDTGAGLGAATRRDGRRLVAKLLEQTGE